MSRHTHSHELSQRLDRIAEFASRIATSGSSDLSGSSGRSSQSFNQRVQTIRSLSSSPTRPSPLGYSSSEHEASIVLPVNSPRSLSSSGTVQVPRGDMEPIYTNPEGSASWTRSIQDGSFRNFRDTLYQNSEMQDNTSLSHATNSSTAHSSGGVLQTPLPAAFSHPSSDNIGSGIGTSRDMYRTRSLPSEHSPLLPLHHHDSHQSHSPISIRINMPATSAQPFQMAQVSRWTTTSLQNIWTPILETVLSVTPRQWILAGVGLIYLGHFSSEDLQGILQPFVCFVARLLQVSVGQCAVASN